MLTRTHTHVHSPPQIHTHIRVRAHVFMHMLSNLCPHHGRGRSRCPLAFPAPSPSISTSRPKAPKSSAVAAAVPTHSAEAVHVEEEIRSVRSAITALEEQVSGATSHRVHCVRILQEANVAAVRLEQVGRAGLEGGWVGH